uniref:Uncharacterized protein n=1 Tax=Anguilla anguilla TaxID=7936 RepID=A0A0E9XA94_ANGAN
MTLFHLFYFMQIRFTCLCICFVLYLCIPYFVLYFEMCNRL